MIEQHNLKEKEVTPVDEILNIINGYSTNANNQTDILNEVISRLREKLEINSRESAEKAEKAVSELHIFNKSLNCNTNKETIGKAVY